MNYLIKNDGGTSFPLCDFSMTSVNGLRDEEDCGSSRWCFLVMNGLTGKRACFFGCILVGISVSGPRLASEAVLDSFATCLFPCCLTLPPVEFLVASPRRKVDTLVMNFQSSSREFAISQHLNYAKFKSNPPAESC